MSDYNLVKVGTVRRVARSACMKVPSGYRDDAVSEVLLKALPMVAKGADHSLPYVKTVIYNARNDFMRRLRTRKVTESAGWGGPSDDGHGSDPSGDSVDPSVNDSSLGSMRNEELSIVLAAMRVSTVRQVRFILRFSQFAYGRTEGALMKASRLVGVTHIRGRQIINAFRKRLSQRAVIESAGRHGVDGVNDFFEQAAKVLSSKERAERRKVSKSGKRK